MALHSALGQYAGDAFFVRFRERGKGRLKDFHVPSVIETDERVLELPERD